MSDERAPRQDEAGALAAGADEAALDRHSVDALIELAEERNAAHAQRLRAVETRSGTLVVFSAIVAGLLIGQEAAGTGVAASAAVVLVIAAAVAAALVAGFASLGFRWPQPASARLALRALPREKRPLWLLEERTVRGAENHSRLRWAELALRVAILLLIAGLLSAAVGWFAQGGNTDSVQRLTPVQVGSNEARTDGHAAGKPVGDVPARAQARRAAGTQGRDQRRGAH